MALAFMAVHIFSAHLISPHVEVIAISTFSFNFDKILNSCGRQETSYHFPLFDKLYRIEPVTQTKYFLGRISDPGAGSVIRREEVMGFDQIDWIA